MFIGNFATYVPSTFPGGGRLSVDFRDQSGTRLECGGSPFNNVCGTSNLVGPPINVQVSQPRADGYQIGMTTIQGVRAYDPGSAQWTTPDAYAGVVSDPMSQQSYMWNDNNPIAYGDPSGFKVKHEVVMVFNRRNETLSVSKDGKHIGTFTAINLTINENGNPYKVNSDAPAPDGAYHVTQINRDTYYTLKHRAAYGSGGVFSLRGPGSSLLAQNRGLLIHAGRGAAFAVGKKDDFSGAWTEGCIRVSASTIQVLRRTLYQNASQNRLIIQ
uniref:L,D-TPase catalytic domain-containing protein n=1 Tax=mine drainage metagenome TaxID=410659 RepID=E6Q3A6_9ZZZZ